MPLDELTHSTHSQWLKNLQGPGGISFNTRLYNGQFPGPTVRIKAGDELQLVLNNKLEANLPGVCLHAGLALGDEGSSYRLVGYAATPQRCQDPLLLSADTADLSTPVRLGLCHAYIIVSFKRVYAAALPSLIGSMRRPAGDCSDA